MLKALWWFYCPRWLRRTPVLAANRQTASAPEDEALDLVASLFGHEAGSAESIRGYEERWNEIDDQMRAVFTLTMLLGTMIEHEAIRRNQTLERVINQIRSDIAGDRYARELGIEPRD
jgi:hypothetical protein